MRKYELCNLTELPERKPQGYLVNGLDLVAIRSEDSVSVLYGRCLHRGALMADGYIRGENLVCGVHNWDYRFDTGVSAYNNDEALHKFTAEIKEGGVVCIDLDEIEAYLAEHPQPFNRAEYLGQYADTHPEHTEPYTSYIRELAQNGFEELRSSWPFSSHGC